MIFFCTEVTFGQKWLKNSIFHYNFRVPSCVSQYCLFPLVTIGHRHFGYQLEPSGLHISSTFVRMRRFITQVGISKKALRVLQTVNMNFIHFDQCQLLHVANPRKYTCCRILLVSYGTKAVRFWTQLLAFQHKYHK